MSVQSTIEDKISTALAPSYIEVINESHMHSVPPGSESHFRLVIVSDRFAGAPRVRRHQMVNGILEAELRDKIHALSMQTLTAAEWEARGQQAMASPPCMGGGKTDTAAG